MKLFLVLAAIFASTFLVAKFFGLISVPKIEGWLDQAQQLSPLYVGVIVALLLFADLFIAVPTLTITILAGYFLGFPMGALAALLGTMTAGCTGYFLSHRFGETILGVISKDKAKLQEAKQVFQQHGFVMILLSRAAPIIPEVSACLAGATRMPFPRFLTAWSFCTLPYVTIAAWAGSVSSIENPKPAIFTAIAITGTLWLAWFAFHRMNKAIKN
ncbi:MAG: VTT domain-containing protein [Kordiimonadaceae bacterium]|nr:VTT domain-containing protein [Kordiimonadaceae bacterium]